MVPANASRRISELESPFYYGIRSHCSSQYLYFSRLINKASVFCVGEKGRSRDRSTLPSCRSFKGIGHSRLDSKDDASLLYCGNNLQSVIGACIAWSVVLLWCPPLEAAELAEAHKVIGDTGREIERVVIQALNWSNGEASQSPRKEPDVLEFGRWRIPRSPEQILTAFTGKEVVRIPNSSEICIR